MMHFFILITLIVFPVYSFAYLDPGTGSYILQVIVGALAGSLFIIKTYWGRIKLFFSKNKTENAEENKPDEQ